MVIAAADVREWPPDDSLRKAGKIGLAVAVIFSFADREVDYGYSAEGIKDVCPPWSTVR